MRKHLALGCLIAAISSFTAAGLAVAQAPPASISGVALDSIRGGYLSNAVISLSGTNRNAVTDSSGNFFIDSVAPGEHSLRIRHALIDSLELSVVTAPSVVRSGESLSVRVSTPGPGAVIAAKCTEVERYLGPAAVLGSVMDAETEDPSRGAEVSVEWSEIKLGEKSIVRVPQKRTARVSAQGTFHLCGLPLDLRAGILARRGADSTAATVVDLSSGLAILALHLPPSSNSPAAVPDDSRARGIRAVPPVSGSAIVAGRITDLAGNPIASARVAVEDDGIEAITSSDGSFRVAGARSGTRAITVRKLGYEPVRTVVDLSAYRPATVDLKLVKFVPVLETVRIRGIRDLALERIGFNARRQRATGNYITPEEIERRSVTRVNDLLRGVSFLRFTRQSDGSDAVSGRPSVGTPGCVRYFIDGTPWMGSFDTPDHYYQPSEIGAIEVYRPDSAPPQFMSFSATGSLCSAIVLWTKAALRLP